MLNDLLWCLYVETPKEVQTGNYKPKMNTLKPLAQ